MITEEERQSIINEAVEKALLKIPEVVGNLISSITYTVRLNREFYEKYPEFANDKEMVAEVVQRVEGENLGLEYEKILEKSVPIIREKLGLLKGLTTEVTKPNRNLRHLQKVNNGEL